MRHGSETAWQAEGRQSGLEAQPLLVAAHLGTGAATAGVLVRVLPEFSCLRSCGGHSDGGQGREPHHCCKTDDRSPLRPADGSGTGCVPCTLNERSLSQNGYGIRPSLRNGMTVT
mmetsp:Transcript_15114/g.12173  ORF Transcript_15114/g.12173 Transcript_15114/m.12173 type:complete len:115 (-) Transcript_15114:3-347(-)